MRGLTLLEVIIALSLIAMVVMISVPSFRDQLNQNKDSMVQAQLLEALRGAQQVANTKMLPVVVCLSRDGRSCVALNGTMVLVFSDLYGDGVLRSDRQIINSFYLKGDGYLQLRVFPYYHQYVLVMPTLAGKSDNGTFWYCDRDHQLRWAITVSQSGEPHVALQPDKSLVCES